MKEFIKTAFLVVLVVLLTSTFLSENRSSLSSNLENDVIIVDKGEALNPSDDEIYYEYDNEDNIFAKIGSLMSSILSKIASAVSNLIGGIFTSSFIVFVIYK